MVTSKCLITACHITWKETHFSDTRGIIIHLQVVPSNAGSAYKQKWQQIDKQTLKHDGTVREIGSPPLKHGELIEKTRPFDYRRQTGVQQQWNTAYTQLLPMCLLCYLIMSLFAMSFLCADEDKHSLVEMLAINSGWMSVNDGLLL